jgi:hypothetical protein
MAASDDEDDEDGHQRRAVAAVRRHHELQQLAAARTAEAGLRMVLSSRARQRASMRPYLLKIGTHCRVSFLFSPTVRTFTKTALVGTYSPTYTQDIYRITGRELGAGSKRVVLYTLETVAALQSGEQAPCTIGTQRVRLPVTLTGCDRRWLMPLASDATPSFANRYPGARLAFNIIDPSSINGAGETAGEDVNDEYDDLRSAVS